MNILAIHGDGALRTKFEYRPTTWISNAVQALCGIQYHAVRHDGTVRPGLYYRGWRLRVQRACWALQSVGGRFL